jgi:hypothetical protein
MKKKSQYAEYTIRGKPPLKLTIDIRHEIPERKKGRTWRSELRVCRELNLLEPLPCQQDISILIPLRHFKWVS